MIIIGALKIYHLKLSRFFSLHLAVWFKGKWPPNEKPLRLTQPETKTCQIGSFPQVGLKIKNIWNDQLELLFNKNPILTCLSLTTISKMLPLISPKILQGFMSMAAILKVSGCHHGTQQNLDDKNWMVIWKLLSNIKFTLKGSLL